MGQHELSCEERVALTTCDHLLDQCVGRGRAEHRRDSGLDVVAVQPFQVESLCRWQADQLRESPPLRWTNGDLVGTVGAHEHRSFVDEVASDVFEELPRCRVGPMKVLEAHDRAVIGRQMCDQVEHRNEQATFRGIGQVDGGRAGREPCAQRGEVRYVPKQLRLPAADLTEQIREGRQRNRVAADVRGPSGVERHTRSVCCLIEDRRLPDTCVTAHHHDRGQPSTGVNDRPFEGGQLRAPTHEVLGAQTVRHGDDQYRLRHGPSHLRGCGRCTAPPLGRRWYP